METETTRKVMTEHRYILELYKGMNTRYACPSCAQRDKTFVRYIDTQTGEHLHPSVGRCNREVNCGYHCTPKQYFQDNRYLFDTPQPKRYTKPAPGIRQQKPVSFIPVEAFEKSLQAHNENNFAVFLYSHFNKFHGEGEQITNDVLGKYLIGTSKQWQGATVFWQIDICFKVRTGKIMLYNSDTGKRYKDIFQWVHKLLEIENYEQCLFGEHLLNLPENRNKPIAIFESEKTAVIASVYFPEMICIACGGLQGLSQEKCKALQRRNVILYPDLSKPEPGKPSAFEIWSVKAKEFPRLFPGTRFQVFDLLERKATEAEKQQGLDLADYLIRCDYKEFQQQEQPDQQQTFEKSQTNEVAQELQPVEETFHFTSPETSKHVTCLLEEQDWKQEISELQSFFGHTPLPTKPIYISKGNRIFDVQRYVDCHFEVLNAPEETLKAINGNRYAFFERIQELKKYLTATYLKA